MDKFGIFKLLNSFFNFYEQNKENFTQKSSGLNLDSLLSSFSKPPQKESETATTKEPIQKTPYPPLQASMLYTMSSHDEFVKRVKRR